MQTRHLATYGVVALAIAAGFTASAGAQAQRPGARGARAGTPAMTPWGEPDLQGIWTNTTSTPFERPDALAGKSVISDEEVANLDRQAARAADAAPRKGDPGTYNDFWFDRGARTNRTSLITEPQTGKLPPLTPKGQELQNTIGKARRSPPTGPEDLSLFERCLTRSLPGAMLPGFYNHNYQIVQTPGYVMLFIEMIHDVRIIPTSGKAGNARPHLASNLQKWLGDSRGRWEGNTLVVETKNVHPGLELRPSRTVMAGTEKLTLVERFTPVDANTMDYQFTVSDPEMFTSPWTVSTPMARADLQIFEYACHEGNHAIGNMLRGARLEEREAAGRR